MHKKAQLEQLHKVKCTADIINNHLYNQYDSSNHSQGDIGEAMKKGVISCECHFYFEIWSEICFYRYFKFIGSNYTDSDMDISCSIDKFTTHNQNNLAYVAHFIFRAETIDNRWDTKEENNIAKGIWRKGVLEEVLSDLLNTHCTMNRFVSYRIACKIKIFVSYFIGLANKK
jgi:hypothetical protein